MAHIDAHHHFWNPARGDYGWMPLDDPILSRAYTPTDLEKVLGPMQVTQTVLVQAAPTIQETEYLLEIADASEMVAKVVGWINFEDENQLDVLKRLAQHPKFVFRIYQMIIGCCAQMYSGHIRRSSILI